LIEIRHVDVAVRDARAPKANNRHRHEKKESGKNPGDAPSVARTHGQVHPQDKLPPVLARICRAWARVVMTAQSLPHTAQAGEKPTTVKPFAPAVIPGLSPSSEDHAKTLLAGNLSNVSKSTIWPAIVQSAVWLSSMKLAGSSGVLVPDFFRPPSQAKPRAASIRSSSTTPERGGIDLVA
jgi:hypothetical protein